MNVLFQFELLTLLSLTFGREVGVKPTFLRQTKKPRVILWYYRAFRFDW